jgi:hypothetical protein
MDERTETRDKSSRAGSGGGARRKRGAQPGNHNALKHGLYTQEVWADMPRRADPADHTETAGRTGAAEDRDAAGSPSLEGEVGMLRSLIRRLFESAGAESSTGGLIEVLRALGVASTRLAVLLRTQRLLEGGGDSQAMQLIQEALAEVMADMEQAAAREQQRRDEG